MAFRSLVNMRLINRLSCFPKHRETLSNSHVLILRIRNLKSDLCHSEPEVDGGWQPSVDIAD